MMTRLLLCAAAVLSVTACATPTTYGPATGGGPAVGFSEYRIETGRYRVSFQGGRGAPPAQVADFALRRAAEVAVRDGYDWFRVVDRISEQTGGGSGGTRVGVGGGGGSYGGGVGAGVSFDLSGGPAYRQTLEVLAGKGPKPEGAYDARDVAGS